jgi:hypothetical protein
VESTDPARSERSLRPARRRALAISCAALAAVAGTALAVGPVGGTAYAESPFYGTETAFQGADGYVHVYGAALNGYLDHNNVPSATAQIAPGTSPSIARSKSGSYFYVAFQSPVHRMTFDTVDSPATVPDPFTVAGSLANGASPSLAQGSLMYAWQLPPAADTPNGQLAFEGGNQTPPTGAYLMPGTNPSVADVNPAYTSADDQFHHEAQIAFQSWDGYLYLAGVTNTRANYSNGTGLTMAPGTSPAIASDGHGHWRVAWQGANHHLWWLSSEHTIADTGSVMMAGTSPAIMLDHDGSNHYEMAIQGWDGALYVAGDLANGRVSNGLGLAPGTSPSITGLANHGWRIAFHASTTDHLWTIDNTNAGGDTNLTVAPGTSPSIATLNQWNTVTTTAPPPPGIKHVNIRNCVGTPGFDIDLPRTISLWARDVTAGADFTRQGSIVTAWNDTACSGAPFVFTPSVNAHVYQIEAIDFNGPDCTQGDDPHGSCQVLLPFAFVADTTVRGLDDNITIN